MRQVLNHYERQSEDEAVTEDEVAYAGNRPTLKPAPHHIASKVLPVPARQPRQRRAG